MAPHEERREFRLRRDEPLHRRLFRMHKGTVLEIVPGPEFRGKCVIFEWNYPKDRKPFDRSRFHRLKWATIAGSCEYGDRKIVVKMKLPGNFNFRFWVEDDEGDRETDPNEGVFLVEPAVQIGGREVTIAGLAIQTVLPASLGPLEEWWERIMVSAKTGFNTIHFCPLQAMGGSRSPYSIRDHRALEPSIFGKDDQKAKENLRDFLIRASRPESEGGLGLFFIIDAVYNHVSKDAPWLRDHPEAGYSLTTAPHLQPAYVLDRAIAVVSGLIDAGSLQHCGRVVPAVVESEQDVEFVLDAFFSHIHEPLKLWEFFVADVEAALEEFRSVFPRAEPAADDSALSFSLIKRHDKGGRFAFRPDIASCAAALKRGGHTDVKTAEKALKTLLEEFNLKQYKQVEEDLAAARTAMKHTMVWERINPRGPRKRRITAHEPMVHLYFADVSGSHTLRGVAEDLSKCPLTQVDPKFILACNGWVWAMDPAKDFVSEEKRSYFRREVIIWGDSVKLRYGRGPEDNPWLWQYMIDYTKELASLFGGLRIDNCHSTPLHVGQAMLDAARAVNPDILVLAELFTQNEETDIAYTNTLGITSLLLECMSTHSAGDYSALLHRFGGVPVGSFSALAHKPLPLTHAHPRATLLAASHDNEFPATKHTVFNSLPLVALAAMIHNGIGSTRCFEELLQENLSVVNEHRRYRSWDASADADSLTSVSEQTGIIAAVRKINTVHWQLEATGFTEIYIDHIDDHCVSATRRNPDTLEEVSTFAFLLYRAHDIGAGAKTLGPFPRSGDISKVLLRSFPNSYHVEYTNSAGTAVGGSVSYTTVEDRAPGNVDSLSVGGGGADRWFRLRLKPGEVICFKVVPNAAVKDHHTAVTHLLSSFASRTAKSVAALTATDLNHALYRCVRENETAPYRGDGVYDVPGFGQLKYAGLAGLVPLLEEVVAGNELGHPLCNNIRQGDWLLAYLAAHMRKRDGTSFLGDAMEEMLNHYKHIPHNAKPKVFTQIVCTIYHALRTHVEKNLLKTEVCAEDFGRRLVIASLQFYGSDATFNCPQGKDVVSMSAGLPHFAAGWMRCWGRDTFIALRGCLLIPGLFDEAKHLLLAFAKVVRHGLVPNLFDNGNTPRYNCRDATWFFLQSVKDYVSMSDDTDFLKSIVTRKFPTDDPDNTSTKDMPLSEVIQEILQRHVDGIEYREWNAGPAIDSDMTDPGFNVSVHVDRTTGFVFGGNEHNCGTWMDKMGSSEAAGNKGIPATPRDGADVEIVGLCKSVVSWVGRLHSQGLYKHAGVMLKDGTCWKFREWAGAIAGSFEKHFWIPLASEADEDFAVDPKLMHRRGIYKDVVGSTHRYTDYQLRPNVAIAMTVAPDLFTPRRANHHLDLCDEYLVGGMGMRTLDPEDWQYRPNYDNSYDGPDKSIAKGWNYHQGPEWLWPVGFHFRARLQFAKQREAAIQQANRYLARHEAHIRQSPWMGLPELFNEHGSECPDSCPTQAWSVGCLVELLHDIHQQRQAVRV